jgi:MFS family permease
VSGPRLLRTRLTWLTYAQLAVYGYFLYGFGPSVPLQRDDLHVSSAVGGLYGTALAVGATLAGFTFAALTRRVGRTGTLRVGLLGLGAGTLLYCLVPLLPVTLAGAFICGMFGSYVVTGSVVVLSAAHGPAGSAAISEANAAAAGAGLVAPLLLGAGTAMGIGWQPGLLVAAVAAAAVWTVSIRERHRPDPAAEPVSNPVSSPAGNAAANPVAQPVANPVANPVSNRARNAAANPAVNPAANPPVEPATAPVATEPATAAGVDRSTDAPGALPMAYWLAWTVTLLCIGVEFSMTFWAADELRQRDGASPAAATAGVTAIVAGMFAGRLLGGRLALRFRPRSLLLAAIAVCLAGFTAFWLSTAPGMALAGLALAGFGIALQYPLGTVRAIAASDRRPDRAAGRLSIAAGLASGIAPFALGALADRTGVHTAFLIVPGLLVAAAAGVLVSRRDQA